MHGAEARLVSLQNAVLKVPFPRIVHLPQQLPRIRREFSAVPETVALPEWIDEFSANVSSTGKVRGGAFLANGGIVAFINAPCAPFADFLLLRIENEQTNGSTLVCELHAVSTVSGVCSSKVKKDLCLWAHRKPCSGNVTRRRSALEAIAARCQEVVDTIVSICIKWWVTRPRTENKRASV